jgi:hypothetical protein
VWKDPSEDFLENVIATRSASRSTSMLNVPYDVLIASQTPLIASTLSDSIGNGFYQGIFLTTSNLAYDAGGGN